MQGPLTRNDGRSHIGYLQQVALTASYLKATWNKMYCYYIHITSYTFQEALQHVCDRFCQSFKLHDFLLRFNLTWTFYMPSTFKSLLIRL